MTERPRLLLACVVVALSACSTRAPSAVQSAASAPAGAMSVPRAVPIAVTLQDGRVLVPGGSNLGTILSACDLYAPDAEAWSTTAPMSTPREYHTATVLADGRVLVTGGMAPSQATASTELYDPVAGSWSPAAPMSTGRLYHDAVRLADGRVLVAGGQGSGGTPLVSAELYDPAANTWTPTTAPLGRVHVLVLLTDGRVLAGGYGAGIQLYDPTTDAWTDAGPAPSPGIPSPPFTHVLARLNDGRVLLATYGKTSWLWDPATGQWSAGPSRAVYRTDHRAALLDDGSVLVAGSSGSADARTVERYDPTANVWVPSGPLLAPRASPGVVALSGGRALVFGGRDPTTGTWPSLSTSEIVGDSGCTPDPDPCASGTRCGTLTNGCGGSVACGACAAGTTCSASQTCVACVPTTCAAQGKSCGQLADGCGGTLSCGSCQPGWTCAANVCTSPSGVPVRDAGLGAPRCTAAGPVCDSGTLLVGRGPLGPEAGAPNTLGGACADGASGSFHADESLDRLVISSTDGAPLTAGKSARIDATVWAFSTADHLDLFSAANASAPAWTLVATLTPASSGLQTLSATLTLPRGALQAIRGTFRYSTTAAACTTGVYDDHDDLVFPVLVPADTTPPVVNLNWPTSNARLSGVVTMSAVAGDDVGVAQVELLVDGAVAFVDSTAPYEWAWDTHAMSNGWHYVGARARDAAGNVSEDGPFSVYLDNDLVPPSVSLIAPAAGASVAGTVVVQASASDDVAMGSVQLLVDGVSLGTVTTSPYTWSWSTRAWPNGPHELRARARDAAGNVAEDGPISVLVGNDLVAPTVTITAPAAGASVSGTVLVQATASDDVGVASVEFRVDGVSIGTDVSAPFEATWATSTWSAGSHTIVATARDAAGNAASASTTVTVVGPPTSTARYDAGLGAPACSGAVPSCDSGTLLDGRATREPNQPNTIDTCTDGTGGTYHSDESLDRLRVFTLDGGPIARGKTVRVEATVWPWSSGASDVLDIWVADVTGAPAWRLAGSVVPPGSGLRTLTVDVTLSSAPRQAIRGVFRYSKSQVACPSGGFDDVDDLAFDVQP